MATIGRITAVQRQQKKRTRVSIEVDGAYYGSLDDIVWVRSGLKVGDALTENAWADMRGRQEAQAAMDRALNLLATRPRGTMELKRLLTDKGFPAEIVENTAARLIVLGYLNDEEYASLLVRDRALRKGEGKRAISAELKRQGIDEETITEAMERYSREEELDIALKQAQKALRASSHEEDNRKLRAKVYASLARRGFSSELIHTVLNRLFSAESDNIEF
jgi:regulatory protein